MSNDEHYRKNLKRTFAGFIGFEGVFGFAMILTHWGMVLPAYLKASGAPMTAVAVVAQAPQFLAMFSMIITLRFLAWRPKRRAISATLQICGALSLLPLAWLAFNVESGALLLIWGSLAIILLRFMLGSMCGPLHYGMMMEVTPLEYRGRLMGARLVAIGVMGFLGAYVTKQMLASGGLPAYGRCFLLSMICFMISVSFYLLIRERPVDRGIHPEAAQPKVFSQLKYLLKIQLFRRWMAAHLCSVASLGGIGLATAYFQDEMGGTDEVVGNLSMAHAGAILISGPLFGVLTDKLGSRFTSGVFFFVYALGFGITAFIGGAPMAYPAFILFGIGHSLSEMWFANYQSELFPDENRVGLLAAIRILASPVAFLSAYLFGLMKERGMDYSTIFIFPFALAVTAVLILLFTLPNPRNATEAVKSDGVDD